MPAAQFRRVSDRHLVWLRLRAQSAGDRGIACGLVIAIALHYFGYGARRSLAAADSDPSRAGDLVGQRGGKRNEHDRSAHRGGGRSDRPMDHARRRSHVQLEDVPGGVRAVPPARHLEARAGAPTRKFAGRLGHRRRRRDGGALRRACYIRIRSFASLYLWHLRRTRMAVRRFPR